MSFSLALALSGVVQADPDLVSNSYRVNESMVGGTGDFNSASSSYKFSPGVDDGGSTLGDNFVGNSSSTSYQVNSGFNTTAQPALTMIVNTGSADLGALSSTVAKTATATFSVKNYTSYGYAVSIVGTAPSNSGHPLTTLATDTASAAGTEQFGLNLVANTSPVTFGADPAQTPGSAFSYGVAGDGATGTYGTTRPYTQNGKFRYVSGETVASSPKSSGETDYTLSFLANMSTVTPGGQYTGNLSIVATGTY